jgi:hypothetical protein
MSTYKIKKYRKKKPRLEAQKIPPEKQSMMDNLCALLGKLGIEVRTESGQFEGGYCIVDENQFFYLNTTQSIDQNIELITNYLKSVNLENIYIPPKTRSQLEQIGICMEA